MAFNRTVVLRYRISLEQRQFAPSTINLRLAAVRRIAYEAADSGLLSPELAAGIGRVKGVRRLGVRVGNWLTAEQGKRLLEATSADTLRTKRNQAMLSLLIGCGLRRAELLGLTMNSIQLREEHWVIADLVGKGGHPHGPDSSLGEAGRGRLDRIGSNRVRPSVPINQQGRQDLGRRDDAKGSLGKSSKTQRLARESRSLHLTISAGLVSVCVISRVASWIRFNFCSGTFRFKRRSGTWAANRSCASL